MPSLRGIFKIAYEPVYKDATQALFRRHRNEIRSNAGHKVDSRDRQSLLVAAHLAGEEEVQRAQDENLADLVCAQEHWPAFMRYPGYYDDSDINDGDENLYYIMEFGAYQSYLNTIVWEHLSAPPLQADYSFSLADGIASAWDVLPFTPRVDALNASFWWPLRLGDTLYTRQFFCNEIYRIACRLSQIAAVMQGGKSRAEVAEDLYNKAQEELAVKAGVVPKGATKFVAGVLGSGSDVSLKIENWVEALRLLHRPRHVLQVALQEKQDRGLGVRAAIGAGVGVLIFMAALTKGPVKRHDFRVMLRIPIEITPAEEEEVFQAILVLCSDHSLHEVLV